MADRTTRQRLWRRGLAAGIVAGVLVLGGGAGWSLTYRPAYTATATLLVLPSARSSRTGDAASYYDTLSQGQIVQTFAQVLRAKSNPGWVSGAGTGLTARQVAGTKVNVTAVPSTSIISITAQGADPKIAERVVEAMAALSPHELNALATPYRALTVDSGGGSAQKGGIDVPELLAAVVAVALLAGVGAQQAVWLLGNASLRAAGRDRRAGSGYDTAGFPIVRHDAETPAPRRMTEPWPAASTRRVASPVSNGSGDTGQRAPDDPRPGHPYRD